MNANKGGEEGHEPESPQHSHTLGIWFTFVLLGASGIEQGRIEGILGSKDLIPKPTLVGFCVASLFTAWKPLAVP